MEARMISGFKSKRFISGLLCSMLGVALVSCAVLQVAPAAAAGVRPMFDLSDPAGSPFPSDRFTVGDASQNTGLRVNLPKPDCTTRTSDCQHIDLLNELDGFNLQPRLSVPFSGPIDVNTVSSHTVFLTSLGSTLPRGAASMRVIGIDQIVWDVATNTLHAEPNELLDQHTSYILVVTRGLRDAVGDPIEPAEPFRDLDRVPDFHSPEDAALVGYRPELIRGLVRLVTAGVVDPREIAAASVFTTMSVTATLEKIRDQIKSATPEPADFNLGPGGTRTVFPLNDVTAITFSAQIGAGSPPAFTNAPVAFAALRAVPDAVGTIAFGKYTSPDYQVHPGEFIPQIATRSGVPVVQQINEIFFNLFLPSGAKPATGWPVAIVGHGNGNDKHTTLLRVAAKMAEHGVATIGINAQGFGFGGLGTLTVSQTTGRSVTFPGGGRGVDQDGNLTIAQGEGGLAAPPRDIIENRDLFVQTAVDLMQLVRVIELGMDIDDDGAFDLDASRIYYIGA